MNIADIPAPLLAEFRNRQDFQLQAHNNPELLDEVSVMKVKRKGDLITGDCAFLWTERLHMVKQRLGITFIWREMTNRVI